MSDIIRKENLERKRAEIVNLAKKIIKKNIDIIEGCIEIKWLWLDAELPENDSYNFFTLISSDTDTFPKGYLREISSEEYLKEQDKKEKEYLKKFEKDIEEECQKLIEKYG